MWLCNTQQHDAQTLPCLPEIRQKLPKYGHLHILDTLVAPMVSASEGLHCILFPKREEEGECVHCDLVGHTTSWYRLCMFLSCGVQSTHRGVSGGEEDGDGWREINVMVSQCNQ